MKLALKKRCSCRKPDACSHDWFLRTHTSAGRVWVNVTREYSLALPMAKADVTHHAAKARHEARTGVLLLRAVQPKTVRTLKDVAEKYEQAHADRSHHYLHGVVSHLGHKAMDEVTTLDIESLVAVWRKRKRFGPNAERHLLQAARHLFNWSIRKGLATKTPFKSAQGVSLISVKASRSRTRRLEHGEEGKLLKHACPYIHDFMTAMIESGCRPGELRTLQWSEVREDDFVILAEKAKTRRERRIPILPTLREILDRRRKGPDGNDLRPDAHVFGNAVGEQMQRRQLCRLWEQTCERANVKNLHLHDLRAEAGSQLLEAGASLAEVRDVLGHGNVSMTSTYLRGRVDSLREAMMRRQRLRLVRGKGSRAQGEKKAASS